MSRVLALQPDRERQISDLAGRWSIASSSFLNYLLNQATSGLEFCNSHAHLRHVNGL